MNTLTGHDDYCPRLFQEDFMLTFSIALGLAR